MTSPEARHVLAYLAALSAHDPDRVVEHVTDDFVNDHASALASGCEGKATYRGRLPGFFASFQDLTYEVEHVIAEGSRVAAAYRMRALHDGQHQLDKRGVMLFELRDGLIARRTDYTDSLTFLQQTGQWEPTPT